MTYDKCKRATFFILFLLFTVLSGCNTEKRDNRISGAVISHRATVPNTVTIYRYGTFPKAKAEKLQEGLKPYFRKVVLKEECLPLPSTYYNKERNRYLASVPHCSNQQCYMVDAEHKMKFHQTVGFCDNCKKKLQSKGWSL